MSDITQIRRAHKSARPKPSNPAWQNAHHDLGVVLETCEDLTLMLERVIHVWKNSDKEPGWVTRWTDAQQEALALIKKVRAP